MKNRDNWAPYLTVKALAMLEALKISERDDAHGAMSFADCCLAAQTRADKNNQTMVVGWQIHDGTGGREPAYGPLQGLSLLTIEPVALVYPLERMHESCKPKKS